MRMLVPLSATCQACSMCELGLKPVVDGHEARDPHVFSSMTPADVMVVGQNPGAQEIKVGQPFVGPAGKNFDVEIAKHGLSRADFYICNCVRCFTQNNDPPTDRHKERCEPFLRLEIGLLKPKLVVTLGAVSFSQFCPGTKYSDGLRQITQSQRYGVPVFAIYHPSPRNLSDGSRRKAFAEQVAVLCALVKRFRKAAAV